MTTPTLRLDWDDNGRVDAIDIAFVRSHYGMVGPLGDVDGSGKVDLRDVALIRRAFGQPAAIATGTDALDAEEVKALYLINQYRADPAQHKPILDGAGNLVPAPPVPLGMLGASRTLTRAAQWKASDCATPPTYLSHDDRDGRHMAERIAAFFPYARQSWLGEVGGLGTGPHATADGMVAMWQASPGHNGILLGTAYTAIGIGHAIANDGPHGEPMTHYWFGDFASINDGWPA